MNKKIAHIPHNADEINDPKYAHEHCWKERALKLLLNDVRNPQGFGLLDYGCGRGEFLEMAKNAGFSVSGVDIDPSCVELSVQHGTAWRIDPEDYLESLADSSFDIVSSFHVLEHVENPKRLLNNMRRVARKYVLIAVPNLCCLRAWKNGGHYSVNDGHLQGWDRETLINLATKHCGLQLIALSSDMTISPSISYRVRKIFGPAVDRAINTHIFSRFWPQKSISLIGLFRVSCSD